MDGSDQLVACVGHRPECSPPRRLEVWVGVSSRCGRFTTSLWGSGSECLVESGIARMRFGLFVRHFAFGIGDGLLHRRRQIGRTALPVAFRGEILLRSRATVYSRSTFRRHPGLWSPR
jgi:hypothetical protein